MRTLRSFGFSAGPCLAAALAICATTAWASHVRETLTLAKGWNAGYVSKKDHDDFVSRADAAKKAYLDKAVSEGVISVRERKLLECE